MQTVRGVNSRGSLCSVEQEHMVNGQKAMKAIGAVDLAQWLKVLDALAEDLGLIISTNKVGTLF